MFFMHVDSPAKIYGRKTIFPNMTIKDGTLAKSCRETQMMFATII